MFWKWPYYNPLVFEMCSYFWTDVFHCDFLMFSCSELPRAINELWKWHVAKDIVPCLFNCHTCNTLLYIASLFTVCKRSLGQGNVLTSVHRVVPSSSGGTVLTRGCCEGGAVKGVAWQYCPVGQQSGCRHPTGMHSCLVYIFYPRISHLALLVWANKAGGSQLFFTQRTYIQKAKAKSIKEKTAKIKHFG